MDNLRQKSHHSSVVMPVMWELIPIMQKSPAEIYAVGLAATMRPTLQDCNWGNKAPSSPAMPSGQMIRQFLKHEKNNSLQVSLVGGILLVCLKYN